MSVAENAVDRIRLWRQLMSPESLPLLERLERELSPGATLKLRQHWSRELIEIGRELLVARVKARRKFPDHAALAVDLSGIEQATSARVAEHKSARFQQLAAPMVIDLCCGVGGDAMSLPRVLAVDRDPVRAWMTQRNAGCPAVAQDVTTLQCRDTVFHFDPARRLESGTAGGTDRRNHAFEDMVPGPAFLEQWLAHNPTGAVKLGPGVDLDAAQRRFDGELELISDGGRLVQAVLWTGALSQGVRTASGLPGGWQLRGRPDVPVAGDGSIDRWLFVADPAVERAALLGALGPREVCPGLGLLTDDTRLAHPALRAYEVLETLPWRWKKIEALLRTMDAGRLDVKVRGKVADANRVSRGWTPGGGAAITLFLFRLGSGVVAVVARLYRD